MRWLVGFGAPKMWYAIVQGQAISKVSAKAYVSQLNIACLIVFIIKFKRALDMPTQHAADSLGRFAILISSLLNTSSAAFLPTISLREIRASLRTSNTITLTINIHYINS